MSDSSSKRGQQCGFCGADVDAGPFDNLFRPTACERWRCRAQRSLQEELGLMLMAFFPLILVGMSIYVRLQEVVRRVRGLF